jgi:hypothetical protein
MLVTKQAAAKSVICLTDDKAINTFISEENKHMNPVNIAVKIKKLITKSIHKR